MGYRVLDNGDIVCLDDKGNPTSEPFCGYVSDEHRKIAEGRRHAPIKKEIIVTDAKWLASLKRK